MPLLLVLWLVNHWGQQRLRWPVTAPMLHQSALAGLVQYLAPMQTRAALVPSPTAMEIAPSKVEGAKQSRRLAGLDPWNAFAADAGVNANVSLSGDACCHAYSGETNYRQSLCIQKSLHHHPSPNKRMSDASGVSSAEGAGPAHAAEM